jgi:hypothetical protein
VAIVLGLLITTTGYLAGKLQLKKAARRRGWTGPLERRTA